jgi:hypothetical protein
MVKMRVIVLLRPILKEIWILLKEVQDSHNPQMIYFLLVYLLMFFMKLTKSVEQFPKNILCAKNLLLPSVIHYLFQMKMTKKQCLKSWKKRNQVLTKFGPNHLLGCGNESDATFLREAYLSLF